MGPRLESTALGSAGAVLKPSGTRLLYHATLALGLLLEDDVLHLAGVARGDGGALQLDGTGWTARRGLGRRGRDGGVCGRRGAVGRGLRRLWRRRRSGRRRDGLSAFDQLHDLVGLPGEVTVRPERIVPSTVRAVTEDT